MFAFGDNEWPGLAKLNEGSGELVQVIGKLMMTHGSSKYWEGVDLRQRLIEEMADQAAAIDFVSDHVLTPVEATRFVECMKQKRTLFELWHREQAEPVRVETEVARRVREETESVHKRHEETHRVLCERNSEIARLKLEQAALVKALGEKAPL